jgi:hypothetical protein
MTSSGGVGVGYRNSSILFVTFYSSQQKDRFSAITKDRIVQYTCALFSSKNPLRCIYVFPFLLPPKMVCGPPMFSAPVSEDFNMEWYGIEYNVDADRRMSVLPLPFKTQYSNTACGDIMFVLLFHYKG